MIKKLFVTLSIIALVFFLIFIFHNTKSLIMTNSNNSTPSYLKHELIKNENIYINNIIQHLSTNNTGYLAYTYVEDEKNPKLFLSFAEQKNYAENYQDLFRITFYDIKHFNLQEYSNNENFSNNCFMKLEIIKLWDDIEAFHKGFYTKDTYRTNLEYCLNTLFSEDTSTILSKTLIDNYEQTIKNSLNNNITTNIENNSYKIDTLLINYYSIEPGLEEVYISF